MDNYFLLPLARNYFRQVAVSYVIPLIFHTICFDRCALILVDSNSTFFDDTFRRVFAAIEKESRRQIEWKVKIERNLLPGLKVSGATDPRASLIHNILTS